MENITDFMTSSVMDNTTQDNVSLTPNTNTEDEAYAQYIYTLAEGIFIWVFPFIMLLGLFGNTLSFMVMTSSEQRQSSVSVYMAALAVADTLVLLLDFLNNWLKMVPKIYLLGSSIGFCRFHRYFFDVVYTYAAWLVTSLAVERFIVVWFPFKARMICTKKTAIISVCVQPVVIMLIYAYNLLPWMLDENGKCNIMPTWQNYMFNVHPWVTGTLYSYVPLIILMFCTSGIIVKLVGMKRRRTELMKTSAEDNDKEYKVARTVVIVCVAFFLLTVPLTLYYGIAFNIGEYVYQGPEMALIETFILIFGLSNHAVNFFLYVVTSERFRVEFVNMVGRCCGVYTKGIGRNGTIKNGVLSGTHSTGLSSPSKFSNKSVSVEGDSQQNDPKEFQDPARDSPPSERTTENKGKTVVVVEPDDHGVDDGNGASP